MPRLPFPRCGVVIHDRENIHIHIDTHTAATPFTCTHTQHTCQCKCCCTTQGRCEHAFIVSDLRLPGPEDDRDARMYPMLSFQKHYRKRRCAVCDARPGQYVAIRDPLGDEARSVYCEFCHFHLHYDQTGNLLHEGFEVFPYLHDE